MLPNLRNIVRAKEEGRDEDRAALFTFMSSDSERVDTSRNHDSVIPSEPRVF